jgi:hypothetical protein
MAIIVKLCHTRNTYYNEAMVGYAKIALGQRTEIFYNYQLITIIQP